MSNLSPDERALTDSYLTQLREAHRYELMGAFDTALLKAQGVVMGCDLPLEQREALCKLLGEIKR